MEIICRFVNTVLELLPFIAVVISAWAATVATHSLISSKKVAAEQIDVLKKEKRPYLSVVKVYAIDDRVSPISSPGFRPVVCLKNTGKCIIHYEVEDFRVFKRLRTKEKNPLDAHVSYENLAYPREGELGIDEEISFFAPIYEIDKIGDGNRDNWLEHLDNLFDIKIVYQEIDSPEKYKLVRSYKIKHDKSEGYICHRAPSNIDS